MGNCQTRHEGARHFPKGNRGQIVAGKSKSAKTGAPSAKAPISSHPIFPVVVAIWFAALLGFGSLILPVILFEKFFAVTGIASLFPAAQAPLGMTARLLIACAAALAGAGAGIFIARKASASRSQPVRRRFRSEATGDRAAKPPINALEEFGTEGLDEPVDEKPAFRPQLAGKRRSLAVTDDSGPSDFLEFAPLPGGSAGLDPTSYVEQEPLHLDDFAQDDHHEDEDMGNLDLARSLIREPANEAVDSAMHDSGSLASSFATPATAPVDFGRSGSGEPIQPLDYQKPEPTEFYAAVAQEHAPMTDDTANHGLYNPLAERGSVNFEPAKPFGAPAMATPQAAFAPQTAPVPAPFASTPAPEVPEMATAPVASNAQAPALQDLGIAELVERFATALQSRAPASAPQAAPAPATFEAPSPYAAPAQAFQAAPVMCAPQAPLPAPAPAPIPAAFAAEPAAEPMVFRRTHSAEAGQSAAAEFSAPVEPQLAPTIPPAMGTPAFAPAPSPFTAPVPQGHAAVPDALRPFAIDDSDADDEHEDDAALTLSLNSSQIYQPASDLNAASSGQYFAQKSSQDDGDEDYDDGNDSYSSLLSMKSALGAQREFVRIEDEEPQGQAFEPVVVFPGQQDRQAQAPFEAPAREQAFAAPLDSDDGQRRFDSPVATRPAAKPAEAGETERALREALEKLQRMSGAA